MFFFLPLDEALEGTPARYLKERPPPEKRAGIFSEVCEVPAFVVTAPFANIFEKGLDQI